MRPGFQTFLAAISPGLDENDLRFFAALRMTMIV
jgi:hypothetical protein